MGLVAVVTGTYASGVFEVIAVGAGALACGFLIWRLFPNDRAVVSEEVDAALARASLRALWFGVAILAVGVLAIALLL